MSTNMSVFGPVAPSAMEDSTEEMWEISQGFSES